MFELYAKDRSIFFLKHARFKLLNVLFTHRYLALFNKRKILQSFIIFATKFSHLSFFPFYSGSMKTFIYCLDVILKMYQSSYIFHCNFSVESKLHSLYYRYVIKFFLSFFLVNFYLFFQSNHYVFWFMKSPCDFICPYNYPEKWD